MEKLSLKERSILVVEDMINFRMMLQIMLKELEIDQLFFGSSFEEGFQCFMNRQPDLCILDINLGKGAKNGIELAEEIRKVNTHVPIIYMTSYYSEEVYKSARHTRPSSFLSKELSRFKLMQALDLAFLSQIKPQAQNSPSNLSEEVDPKPYPSLCIPHITDKNIFFKVGDTYKAIPAEDIDYFFSKERFSFARVRKRNYPTSVQLKVIEQELFPTFLRIHKTFIVNRNKIQNILPKESKLVIQNEHLPIGYTYRKDFFNEIKLLK